MKPNKDKCNLLISGGKNITINIDGNNIEKKQLWKTPWYKYTLIIF